MKRGGRRRRRMKRVCRMFNVQHGGGIGKSVARILKMGASIAARALKPVSRVVGKVLSPVVRVVSKAKAAVAKKLPGYRGPSADWVRYARRASLNPVQVPFAFVDPALQIAHIATRVPKKIVI